MTGPACAPQQNGGTCQLWLQVRVYGVGAYFVVPHPSATPDKFVAVSAIEVATCGLSVARQGLGRFGSHVSCLPAFDRVCAALCDRCVPLRL
jgi:hypothetical protein